MTNTVQSLPRDNSPVRITRFYEDGDEKRIEEMREIAITQMRVTQVVHMENQSPMTFYTPKGSIIGNVPATAPQGYKPIDIME